MKRAALVFAFVLAGAGFAHAGPISTGNVVQVKGTSGTVGGGGFGIDGPDAGTVVDFVTFCLERDEYISYNTNYYAKLSNEAVGGGLGGPSPDPLDTRTAYLYAKFLAGGFGPMTADKHDALQLAIWRIEEETTAIYSGLGNVAKRALADTYYNEANSTADGSLYGIGVMQLWATASFTGYQQDLLVSVPDGGTTLMLLGSALMGLGVLRRKFSA